MTTTTGQAILLYYSDQVAGSDHASVEALFHRELNAFFEVFVVYYDRNARQSALIGERKIVVPYRARGELLRQLAPLLPLERVACVITRNAFPVHAHLLEQRGRWGFKVCFHYSFPHTFRHYYAERGFGFARLRKWLTWRWRHHVQMGLMRRADGFLPISERMPAMLGLPGEVPVFPIHSGVDCARLPPPASQPPDGEGVCRFLYVGTVDELRRMDVVLAGFGTLEREDWRLEIFTAQEAFTRELVARVLTRHRERVVVHPALPRERLYQAMTGYHAALCLIPPTELYRVSSPLKLMEYYAMGLPVVMSELPECRNLFGEAGCGWFGDFDPVAIGKALEAVIRTDPAERFRMGRVGREIVARERNYAVMAARLSAFLRGL